MRLIVFIGMYLFAALCHGSESYLCIPDMATGFSFKQQAGWNVARFKTEDKFLVTHPNEAEKKEYKDPTLSWVVKRLGSTKIEATCGNSPELLTGAINCEGLGEIFKVNFKNLRFLRAHLLGFYTDKTSSSGSTPVSLVSSLEEGTLTPLIEIGKCSPL